MDIRIRFSKKENMAYLGHLDLMRFFQRALRRADFPLEYTKGFHPHPIMSFAQPLSVGTVSEGEYFDVKLCKDIDISSYKDSLNQKMIEGIFIKSIEILPEKYQNAMSAVAAADYTITVDFSHTVSKEYQSKAYIQKAIEDFLSKKEIIYKKQAKKTEIIKDIKPSIYKLSCIEDAPVKIYAFLQQGSEYNLPPTPVIELLFDLVGIPKDQYSLRLCRIDTYKKSDEGFVSLGQGY